MEAGDEENRFYGSCSLQGADARGCALDSWDVSAGAQEASLEAQIRERSAAVEKQLIDWRRDIHQHPELGDQEQRTSRLVAEHLKRLGLDVQTGVGRTGVVGILKGAKPGPVVGLRADMDALPVTEPEGLPFASRARAVIRRTRWGSCMHAATMRTRRC